VGNEEQCYELLDVEQWMDQVSTNTHTHTHTHAYLRTQSPSCLTMLFLSLFVFCYSRGSRTVTWRSSTCAGLPTPVIDGQDRWDSPVEGNNLVCDRYCVWDIIMYDICS
jgi:hypothetical protein